MIGGRQSGGAAETASHGASTDRAREAERGDAADTIDDLQQRIDILSAFTGGILMELDREGRYLRVWTGEPQLLARPIEELLGYTVTHVLGPAAGTRFHDAFRSVADTGMPVAFEYPLDVQAGRRTFSCEIRPHDGRGGAPRTVTLLIRDVTAAKAVEAKLLQAERLAALGLLAASVGHEIRQPLAYVSTSLDVLERELGDTASSEAARASVENLRSGARRIAEIAASLDLLTNQRPRVSRPVDVRSAVDAALALCATELSGFHVERGIGALPPVSSDEGELCQVFANLLLNAAQASASSSSPSSSSPASPASPEPPRVLTVRAALAGNRVRVSVSDTGAGMSAEQLERIFDPFFTTKGTKGTGLGLFVTKCIIEGHGGTLNVESVLGAGTTVDVLLPVATPEAPPANAPALGAAAAVAGSVPVVPRPRLELLLIDDEPRFLASLRLALNDTHDVDTCNKARDALELLEKEPRRYDAVICDLAMPDVDGVTFYERMQSLGIGDRFILMTGGAFTPRGAEFVARNTCPTVGKPFLIERLLAVVDDVTRNRRAS